MRLEREPHYCRERPGLLFRRGSAQGIPQNVVAWRSNGKAPGGSHPLRGQGRVGDQ